MQAKFKLMVLLSTTEGAEFTISESSLNRDAKGNVIGINLTLPALMQIVQIAQSQPRIN
jgi:hypothetical protein